MKRNHNITYFLLHLSGLFGSVVNRVLKIYSCTVKYLIFHKVIMTLIVNKLKGYFSNKGSIHLINDLFLLKIFMVLNT